MKITVFLVFLTIFFSGCSAMDPYKFSERNSKLYQVKVLENQNKLDEALILVMEQVEIDQLNINKNGPLKNQPILNTNLKNSSFKAYQLAKKMGEEDLANDFLSLSESSEHPLNIQLQKEFKKQMAR